MTKILPANRVAVIAHVGVVWGGAIAAFITAVNGSFPQSWQGTGVAIASIVGGVAGSLPVILKFLDGSQQWDALQSVGANVGTPEDAAAADAAGEGGTVGVPYTPHESYNPPSGLTPAPAGDPPAVEPAPPQGTPSAGS